MLKKILNLEGVKELDKHQQSKLQGGLRSFCSSQYFMCCWDDDPNNCSACVATNNPTCVPSAHPVECC